ncbi:MAG: TetR family transcriptional regulator [Deltaproteobacteria bacterium]|nr:TetR family transcriptional regulator [Deltaproteobacteria bacterium]
MRAICDAAGANVSAVKYHFGSKEELYLEVWHTAAAQMGSGESMPRLEEFDDPREALRSFIAWFMRLVLTESKTHPWAGKLLAHETVSPTPRGRWTPFVHTVLGPDSGTRCHGSSARLRAVRWAERRTRIWCSR